MLTMVNTFTWQVKGCWFHSSWRHVSHVGLLEEGCPELPPVVTPCGKRVAENSSTMRYLQCTGMFGENSITLN